MSKDLLISNSATNTAPLSREQKQYNNLIDQIEKLRKRIDLYAELDTELRSLGNAKVLPIEQTSGAIIKEFLLAFEKSPFKDGLKSKKKQKFKDIVFQEVRDILAIKVLSEDAELIAIFDKYNEDGQTFAEVQAAEKMEATSMFNAMFGMDLEQEDLDDPEKLMEKVNAKRAEIEAEAAQDQARKKEKKQSPKQAAAAAKREAAQSTIKKSVKQIYHDLVKHFHPDKESDEVRKAEKTEIMKQITAAYDADDHLKLMQLQMTLLSDSDNIFARFDNQQLHYFNEALNEQVQELRHELMMNSPENNGNIYASFFSEKRSVMLANIEKYIKNQKKMMKTMESQKDLISTAYGFKMFVDHFELDEEEFEDWF